jgi:hypothetical protein
MALLSALSQALPAVAVESARYQRYKAVVRSYCTALSVHHNTWLHVACYSTCACILRDMK